MIHGIDISSYQSSTLSLTGLDFCIVKVTEGLSYTNPKWIAQRDHARKSGLVVGYYHYPHIANDPVKEAEFFLSKIKLIAGDVLCLDWEWYGQKNISKVMARNYKTKFLAELKSKAPGHKRVLYADRSNWLTVDSDSNCGDALWIADPTTAGKPRVQHPWTFHQYSTAGNLDHNVANFASLVALREWAGVAVTNPPVTTPAKPVTPPSTDAQIITELQTAQTAITAALAKLKG